MRNRGPIAEAASEIELRKCKGRNIWRGSRGCIRPLMGRSLITMFIKVGIGHGWRMPSTPNFKRCQKAAEERYGSKGSEAASCSRGEANQPSMSTTPILSKCTIISNEVNSQKMYSREKSCKKETFLSNKISFHVKENLRIINCDVNKNY